MIAIGIFIPMATSAQQVNNFGVCTQYREVYQPGYYDSYGNYVQGRVSTQSYNVPCNQLSGTSYPQNQYYNNNYGYRYGYNNGYVGRPSNPNCNPTRTLLGATLGGAIGRAAAMNYPKNYGWATALGASIGGLAFAC